MIEHIFNSFSLANIHEYLENKQEENFQLEFKTVNDSNMRQRDDRKHLAVAFSAFANSSGGLIVWGVNARKNDEQIDCAVEIVPVRSIGQFVARLNELTGQATSPTVNGIQHKPILTDADAGIVVTYVPESDSGPYMAKLAEDRYYKRSGDSFYRMEHYDLADMFGRRKKPVLEITVKPVELQSVGRSETIVRFLISVENKGRGTAKSPFLSLILPDGSRPWQWGVDGNGKNGLQKIASSNFSRNHYAFGANTDVVIHPGMKLDITHIVVPLEVAETGIHILGETSAEDSQMQGFDIFVSSQEISALSGGLST